MGNDMMKLRQERRELKVRNQSIQGALNDDRWKDNPGALKVARHTFADNKERIEQITSEISLTVDEKNSGVSGSANSDGVRAKQKGGVKKKAKDQIDLGEIPRALQKPAKLALDNAPVTSDKKARVSRKGDVDAESGDVKTQKRRERFQGARSQTASSVDKVPLLEDPYEIGFELMGESKAQLKKLNPKAGQGDSGSKCQGCGRKSADLRGGNCFKCATKAEKEATERRDLDQPVVDEKGRYQAFREPKSTKKPPGKKKKVNSLLGVDRGEEIENPKGQGGRHHNHNDPGKDDDWHYDKTDPHPDGNNPDVGAMIGHMAHDVFKIPKPRGGRK